jgi:two-component system chemotaxis response regulator CheY
MKHARVLVVEDEAVAASVISDQMRRLGHEIVDCATTGAAAIASYEKNRPDMVTMDVNLPDFSGMEAARRILRAHPKAIILLVTCEPREKRLIDALSAGVKGYVEKPVQFQQLRDIVESLLLHYL